MIYAGSGLAKAQMPSNSKPTKGVDYEYSLPMMLYYIFLTKNGRHNLKYVNSENLYTIMEISMNKELAKEAGQYARGGFMKKKNSSIIIRLIVGEFSGVVDFIKETIRYIGMTVKIWICCCGKK